MPGWPGGLAQTPSGRDSSDGDGVSAGGEVGQDDGNVAAGKARHVAGPARSPDPPPVHGCFDVVTLPRKTLAHAMPDDRHIADQAIILPRPSRRSAAPCRCARVWTFTAWIPIDSGTRRVGLMASLRGRAAPGLVRIGSARLSGRAGGRDVQSQIRSPVLVWRLDVYYGGPWRGRRARRSDPPGADLCECRGDGGGLHRVGDATLGAVDR